MSKYNSIADLKNKKISGEINHRSRIIMVERREA